MGSKSKNQIMTRWFFSWGAGENMDLFFNSDMVNPLLNTNGRRDRRFNLLFL